MLDAGLDQSHDGLDSFQGSASTAIMDQINMELIGSLRVIDIGIEAETEIAE